MPYREMLLSELIEKYAPVYPQGEDWAKTVSYLYEEEGELMEMLTDSLKRYGWREPVVLSEPEDLYEDQNPCVLNGTHRVVIALQQGVFTVPVATRRELGPEPDLPLLVAKIKAIGQEFTEQEDDIIMNALRSWPLDKDTWITSSVCFGSRDSLEVVLDFDDQSRCVELEKMVKKILKKKLPNRKFSIVVEPEEPFDPEED